jgi:hypothetical protein
VGVPAGTKLRPSGDIVVRRPGAVIDGVDVTGEIDVEADNVTIENSRITNSGGGGRWGVYLAGDSSGLTIRSSEVRGAGPEASQTIEAAVIGSGVTFVADYLHNCADCIEYGNNVTDSYILNNGHIPGAHYEDLYGNDQTVNVQHSVLLNPFPQTATVFVNVGNGNGGACVNNVTVNNSLLAGGGYLMYPCSGSWSSGASVHITNNRFARCTTRPLITALYGTGGTTCSGGGKGDGQVPDSHGYYPHGGYFGINGDGFCGQETWTGNVWDDNGAPVSC